MNGSHGLRFTHFSRYCRSAHSHKLHPLTPDRNESDASRSCRITWELSLQSFQHTFCFWPRFFEKASVSGAVRFNQRWPSVWPIFLVERIQQRDKTGKRRYRVLKLTSRKNHSCYFQIWRSKWKHFFGVSSHTRTLKGGKKAGRRYSPVEAGVSLLTFFFTVVHLGHSSVPHPGKQDPITGYTNTHVQRPPLRLCSGNW